MKKLFFLLFLPALIISCRNNKADQPQTAEDSTNVTEPTLLWQANDSNGLLNMQKIVVSAIDSISVSSLVDYFNGEGGNGHIKLDFVKSSGDTIYLKIDDATYLTQQMGSSGANSYLAEVVYNFTELPGIRYVNLDFPEGDHAIPGTFNRDTFKDQ